VTPQIVALVRGGKLRSLLVVAMKRIQPSRMSLFRRKWDFLSGAWPLLKGSPLRRTCPLLSSSDWRMPF